MKRMHCHTMYRIGIALCCVSLLGCASTTAHTKVMASSTATPPPAATATSTMTATSSALPWVQAATNPGGGWAFAKSDGTIGYSCITNTDRTTTIWVTHDRGAHATQIATLPAVQGGEGCDLRIDDGTAAIAVAKISGAFPETPFVTNGGHALTATMPHSSPGPNEISDFLTMDGGQNWHVIPKYVTLDRFVSVGSRLYAFIGVNPRYAGEPLVRDEEFVMSDDGMQTWQQLTIPMEHASADDAFPLASTPLPYQMPSPPLSSFFADQYTGDLLDESGAITGNATLQRSSDGGSTWSTESIPAGTQQFIASVASLRHSLTICAIQSTTIWCSTDDGQTWQQRAFTDQITFNTTHNGGVTVFGVASNGDIVASFNNEVLRLQLGATHWQTLFAAPDNLQGIYGPESGNILWEQSTDWSTWSSAMYP
jgi:hypothetical protein